jgi:hypothetical protein
MFIPNWRQSSDLRLHRTRVRRVRAAATVFAALALASTALDVLANTYCAHNATELSTALTDAGNGGTHNGQSNVVHITDGTFTTSAAPFFFGTTSAADLTLDGGWNTSCTIQNLSPGMTVLDGGGSTQVLSIGTNGDLTVAHLTIRNGNYGVSAGSGAAIALNGLDAGAILIFSNNVVRDNVSTFGGGGAGLAISGNGTVTVENNLFTGNSSTTAAALAVSLTVGTAYLTNNTITHNTNSTSASSITSIGASTATGYVSNTISYANLGPGIRDFYLYGTGKVLFVHDDYSSIDGGAAAAGGTGNFAGVDPKFASASDFHLKSSSPVLRAGTTIPSGGLPDKDLDGNPRIFAGKIDLGAYENVDAIFFNGFDAP